MIVRQCAQRRTAVNVAVCPSENRGPAGCADRICAKTVAEAHAALSNPVEIRRLVYSAAVATHGMRSVIVRHDEQDLWSLLWHQ